MSRQGEQQAAGLLRGLAVRTEGSRPPVARELNK